MAARSEVWNEWACALMCASRAENGCCAYQGALGLCDFVPGGSASDPAEGWTHAACTPGFSTAKCAPWSGGKCRGRPKARAFEYRRAVMMRMALVAVVHCYR